MLIEFEKEVERKNMRKCRLCGKTDRRNNGPFFNVPKSFRSRLKWFEICGIEFKPNQLVCGDHFLPEYIATCGPRNVLLPTAAPFVVSVH